MASPPGGRRARQAAEPRAHHRGGGESRRTILVALAANAVIACTKLAGGLVSGSTALLAEAAHSLADTTNQAFLLASIALAGRPPTERQPFGHGRERFLWTFIAAVGMFVAGALFAVGYGAFELIRGPTQEGGFAVAWISLAIAALAEGTSWVRALRQTRGEARRMGRRPRTFLRVTRDPTAKMVVFEDSAALAGVALAGGGIALHQITGQAIWDPIASIAIGVLLIGVAIWMGRDVAQLLVGASARPDERAEIERVLEDHRAVREVLELLTMVLGPNSLLVAARVDFDDDQRGGAAERAAEQLDAALRDRVPDITHVFLDPTPRGSG